MVAIEGHTAEFRFYRPRAHNVFLVGDFNSWDSKMLPMVRTADGHWLARVELPEGDFRFRYRADDEWFIDYAAFGLDTGPFGLDSIVHIQA